MDVECSPVVVGGNHHVAIFVQSCHKPGINQQKSPLFPWYGSKSIICGEWTGDADDSLSPLFATLNEAH